MVDWFEDAPEWATVVLHWADMGYVIYLETDVAGCAGRIKAIKNGVVCHSVKESPHDHIWWDLSNQSQVVARRGDAMARPRYLTEEEVAVLSDLGLLEEALEKQGIYLPLEGENLLNLTVWDADTGAVQYEFYEGIEGDHIANVGDFFEVVETVYNKLGFKNKVTISADFGTTGFNKIIGES